MHLLLRSVLYFICTIIYLHVWPASVHFLSFFVFFVLDFLLFLITIPRFSLEWCCHFQDMFFLFYFAERSRTHLFSFSFQIYLQLSRFLIWYASFSLLYWFSHLYFWRFFFFTLEFFLFFFLIFSWKTFSCKKCEISFDSFST